MFGDLLSRRSLGLRMRELLVEWVDEDEALAFPPLPLLVMASLWGTEEDRRNVRPC